MNLYEITFKVNKAVNANEVADLFKASGIRRPVDDLTRIDRMISNADITITAWNHNRLVGMARAITDFSYCCYLSDLAVHEDFQKKGIGRNLISLLEQEIGENVSLILLASPVAMDYYPHIGFQSIQNGFIKPRKR